MFYQANAVESLSARRAWIEILIILYAFIGVLVALRKESVDRNLVPMVSRSPSTRSLSARRAWIEMEEMARLVLTEFVALRKESVDRNKPRNHALCDWYLVALRKESVDRNTGILPHHSRKIVALRKESVDRNHNSVRRCLMSVVALRKESVDRNRQLLPQPFLSQSLSARRAWIEIKHS